MLVGVVTLIFLPFIGPLLVTVRCAKPMEDIAVTPFTPPSRLTSVVM